MFFTHAAESPLHVSRKLPFAAAPDPRWRPFVNDGRYADYQSLIQLTDRQGGSYGDALVIARRAGGGGVVYGWFGLFNPTYGPRLLADLFDWLAAETAP